MKAFFAACQEKGIEIPGEIADLGNILSQVLKFSYPFLFERFCRLSANTTNDETFYATGC
jgi:hypothetical protein